MNKKNHISHDGNKNKQLFGGAIFIILFFTVLGGWFVFTARTAQIFDIKPTHLILRSDGCNFLKSNGIETKAAEPGNGCSVLVPFRQNMFSSGGLITLGETQIRIADDQVVIVGSVEDQPWTPAQIRAVIEMLASTIIMLGMLVWILRRIVK
jgi:hypothetical protein